MHWFIIILAILVIVVLQFWRFSDTLKKIKQFWGIFPEDCSETLSIFESTIVSSETIVNVQKLEQKYENLKNDICRLNDQLRTETNDVQNEIIEQKIREYEKEVTQIGEIIRNTCPQFSPSDNSVQNTIIGSINDYLSKNRNTTSDFSLIKDIVDRNSDAVEDEIQSQIPVPLYLGLMGTMIGILVGVGYLVLSGDLSALLNAGNDVASTKGISSLMGGVALAMIASIVGIILTTIGTRRLKEAKSNVEQKKHRFLTWMQTNLLPVMSSDTASALAKMTKNLTQFNSTFSGNTKELKKTLEQIKESTQGQADILSALQNLPIKKISQANIEVYEKLKNCTNEIGNLAELLKNSTEYLEKVHILSERIDKEQDMIGLIAEMKSYFHNTQNALSGLMSQTIGDAEQRLRDATNTFNNNISEQYQTMIECTTQQTKILQDTIKEQNEALRNRVKEFEILTNEIKKLTLVSESMAKLEKTTAEQNKKIDNLSKAIRELATQKATGGTIQKTEEPRVQHILKTIVGGIVVFTCIVLIIFLFSNMINNRPTDTAQATSDTIVKEQSVSNVIDNKITDTTKIIDTKVKAEPNVQK